MTNVINLFDVAPDYMRKHQRLALHKYRTEQARKANPQIDELLRIAKTIKSHAVFKAYHRELLRTMYAMYPGWNSAARRGG